jgi:hypothetical protein
MKANVQDQLFIGHGVSISESLSWLGSRAERAVKSGLPGERNYALTLVVALEPRISRLDAIF